MRHEHLTVRVPRQDKVELESAAQLAGLSRSELIRQGAREKAREIFRRAAEGDREAAER